MFVLPEYHGKGIAQLLFNTVVDFAKSQKFKKLILTTDTAMIRAQKFYEKNGFNKVGHDGTKLRYEKKL